MTDSIHFEQYQKYFETIYLLKDCVNSFIGFIDSANKNSKDIVAYCDYVGDGLFEEFREVYSSIFEAQHLINNLLNHQLEINKVEMMLLQCDDEG